MSRLTRDGTAEPVSRDEILRRERGQGNSHFPCSADHKQDWQPYAVDPYSCYVYIKSRLNPQTALSLPHKILIKNFHWVSRKYVDDIVNISRFFTFDVFHSFYVFPFIFRSAILRAKAFLYFGCQIRITHDVQSHTPQQLAMTLL